MIIMCWNGTVLFSQDRKMMYMEIWHTCLVASKYNYDKHATWSVILYCNFSMLNGNRDLWTCPYLNHKSVSMKRKVIYISRTFEALTHRCLLSPKTVVVFLEHYYGAFTKTPSLIFRNLFIPFRNHSILKCNSAQHSVKNVMSNSVKTLTRHFFHTSLAEQVSFSVWSINLLCTVQNLR